MEQERAKGKEANLPYKHVKRPVRKAFGEWVVAGEFMKRMQAPMCPSEDSG